MNHSIIVGGTKGLGRVVAKKFAKRGDKVSIIGRSENIPEDLIAENIQYFKCDITERFKTTLDEIIREQGQVNYCVFLQRYRGKERDWEGEFETTVTATKNIVEYLIPHFSPHDDKSILMVSSVFSNAVGEGQLASYHIAKASLDQLMRYYAVKLGAKAIRSNAISPFTFLKEESKSFYENNMALLDLYKAIVPLKRMGTTEDSARVIQFLCSADASFLTGQNIVVDGGLSLIWQETLARQLKQV